MVPFISLLVDSVNRKNSVSPVFGSRDNVNDIKKKTFT